MASFNNDKLQQIKNRLYEISPYCANRNIRLHLSAIMLFSQFLEDDEEINFFSEASKLGMEQYGVIFITNKRFIFCMKNHVTCIKEFRYKDIERADYEINAMGQGIIRINFSEFNFNGVNNLEIAVQYIKDKMRQLK